MVQVATVTTDDDGLLHAVRRTVSDANSALLCVAFVNEAGVKLISEELKRPDDIRLLVTTAFGTTTQAGLDTAVRLGAEVRVLNPVRTTFHPKLYAGVSGDRAAAVIGSSNLTGGLATNVEVASHLTGRRNDTALANAWDWAERLWTDERTVPWDGEGGDFGLAPVSVLPHDLMALISYAVAQDPVFLTLGSTPKPNRIVQVAPEGLYVETERSTSQGQRPQLVDAWMLETAWKYLLTRGRLTNSFLLNELRVHRSSAVCAVLARLPGVRSVGRGGRVELEVAQ